ncbi:MAG: putative spermidine/putrescine transport system ATP-binding protein [Rhodospirillaceae bacterium]|nr:putative spermidine/putrescine transport system ATP-binding protein [Rhodospirillaceae bacterium]
MTLIVSDLHKSFGDFQAVRGVSFELNEGDVLSLLGPSGCGKTTTLRMLAGFEQPTAGSIRLKGRDITRLPARRRNIGMVFQSYALFPHMNAAENVAFGLEMRNLGRAECQDRVRRALDIVRMASYADRSPKSLSGGQQQRIALARALVVNPDLLLLDEPLSALDLKLREEMREEIYRIVRELNITTVFVTHDQSEALVLANQVAVMNAGVIEQLDAPEQLYRRPQTAFVADFIGGANILRGRIESGGHLFEAANGLTFDLPAHVADDTVAVAIRPEDIKLNPASEDTKMAATVRRSRFLGNVIEYTLELPSGDMLTARGESLVAFAEGASVAMSFRADRIAGLGR